MTLRHLPYFLRQRRVYPVLIFLVSANFSSYFFLQTNTLGPAHSCQVLQSSNISHYSSPELVTEYLSYSSCLGGGSRLDTLHVNIGSQGEFLVVADYTYWPPNPGVCPSQGAGASVFYVILSRGGAESRARMRRLWTKRVESGSSYRFLLMDSQREERSEVEREQGEHEDIVITSVKEKDSFSSIHLVISALQFALTRCSKVRYVALVQDDVFVNTKVIAKFSAAETYAANRVYGALYRDYGPTRSPAHPHHTPETAWPWPRYPPFLGPEFLLLSMDTLPRMLQEATQVPLFHLWEIWLTGLVSLRAGILRIGIKQFFASVTGQAGVCQWPHYGVITGLGGGWQEEVLAGRLGREVLAHCSNDTGGLI